MHTTKVKSVYEELGFPNAGDMLVKARLVAEIADQVKRRKLTQSAAAELLGFTQPKLSKLLRGQFRGVSEKKLMECLTKLGRDVEINIKTMPRSRRIGQISVAKIIPVDVQLAKPKMDLEELRAIRALSPKVKVSHVEYVRRMRAGETGE